MTSIVLAANLQTAISANPTAAVSPSVAISQPAVVQTNNKAINVTDLVVPAQQPQIVQPPVEQPPILTIDNVEVTPSGKLAAGDVLNVRAFGSPNAMASFSIKGGVQGVPMEERRDGVYDGSYTVRKTDNIGHTRVYVALNRRGAQPASGESRAELMLDAMPPEIMVEPGPNAVARGGQTSVVVKYSDGHGSGVDPASVHLLINGRDVTSEAILDGGMVAFRPGLPLFGLVNAEIKLADRCGNAVDYTWTFNALPAVPGAFAVPGIPGMPGR